MARDPGPVPGMAGPLGAPPRRCPGRGRGPGQLAARCALRERERQIGSGFGFGIFVGERFVGELTLSSIQRGPFQSGSIGYWIDRDWAGQSLVPEAVVVTLRFAFEMLGLHRVEVSIIPRNQASRRVAEKLDLRLEGLGAVLGDRRALGGPRALRDDRARSGDRTRHCSRIVEPTAPAVAR